MSTNAPHFPIVFFDGACGLCDRSVRWILERDRHQRFRFAPLQGTTYAQLDRPDKPTDLSTLVVATDDALLIRSDAALAILTTLGRPWAPIATLARLCPRPIRDAAYRLIARHRLRVFGGAEACRLPDTREIRQLLP